MKEARTWDRAAPNYGANRLRAVEREAAELRVELTKVTTERDLAERQLRDVTRDCSRLRLLVKSLEAEVEQARRAA